MSKFADSYVPGFADCVRPVLADFTPRTLAWVIQRVIEDVATSQTTIKQFGTSQLFSLKRLQRAQIGKVIAADLSKQDVINHCKERRKTVCPATAKQDITHLRGVLTHAADAFEDCENLSCEAIEAARRFLVKNNLIGKSTPRTRRPSDEEIGALLTDFAQSDARKWTQIKMVPVVAFGLVSSRRRGEVVRITHGDVDYEKRVYWVRDVKHPTRKKGNDKCFVLWPELEQIIKLQPRMSQNNPTERIFPYNGESVGKRYIDAKKRLGIVNLRMHDNRREAVSKWLLKLGSKDLVRKLVSGHDSEKVFDTVYDGRSTLEIMQAEAAMLSRFMTKEPTNVPA